MDGWQLERGLNEFFTFYNRRRYHQALSYRTPAQVFET
jgi:transposase InsO family protein